MDKLVICPGCDGECGTDHPCFVCDDSGVVSASRFVEYGRNAIETLADYYGASEFAPTGSLSPVTINVDDNPF